MRWCTVAVYRHVRRHAHGHMYGHASMRCRTMPVYGNVYEHVSRHIHGHASMRCCTYRRLTLTIGKRFYLCMLGTSRRLTDSTGARLRSSHPGASRSKSALSRHRRRHLRCAGMGVSVLKMTASESIHSSVLDYSHNYMGHNYMGHNYIGDNYMGHNYITSVRL